MKLKDFNIKSSKKLLEWSTIPFLFGIVAYLFLGANIAMGKIVAPMDLLLQFNGWRESGLSLPLFNGERSDVVDAILPRWIFLRNQIINGKLPLWNPLAAGGEPALFHLPNSTFSIGFLLFLLFGDGVGFTLTLLARLVIAGLGSYILCRTRLEILPSIFGGITYMMCGFNASWLMWTHVETSAWIPWVLWAVIRLEDQPSNRRMVILSLTVAALIFGGFPAVAGYGLYAALLLTLWLLVTRALHERNRIKLMKHSFWILGGIIFGFLLAFIQLLPFIEFMKQFDISWRHSGGISIENFILILNPFLYGQPRVERTGYVGLLTLFLAFLAISAAIWESRWRSGPLSPVLWSVLTCLTFIAVYQTPMSLAHLLYRLPVLNNNSSNRMLSLFGLELAILGAIGFQVILDKLKSYAYPRRLPRKAFIILILLIIVGLHIIDIARVGRAQNAVVPIETFFPDTPSIHYIQEHLKPGQSVLATGDAYLISGTLGAYDIPEWFAHAYHTEQEKNMLTQLVHNPWASPTAARFSFEQIDLESDVVDALGIRYILTSHPVYINQEDNDAPAPPMPYNTLGQVIQLYEPINVIGIQLLMATYGRATAGSDVRLIFLNEFNLQLAECIVNGNAINDNSWVTFKFDNVLKLRPGVYKFKLNTVKLDAQPVTVWALVKKDGFPDGYITINDQPGQGDLTFRLLAIPERKLNSWNIAYSGPYITILERKDSPPGAYFLQGNASFDKIEPHSWSWKNVELFKNDVNNQVFIVKTNTSGWLVRIARFWPGWKVYVNGKPAEPQPYLGILPAVHLEQGASIVEWRYEPRSLKVGAVISGLTATFLLIFSIGLPGIPKSFSLESNCSTICHKFSIKTFSGSNKIKKA